jgi:hypothetical protein
MQNLCAKICIEMCDDFEIKERFRKDALVHKPLVFLQCSVGS